MRDGFRRDGVCFPGLAITISVPAFNLLRDGIRDILDPRLCGAV